MKSLNNPISKTSAHYYCVKCFYPYNAKPTITFDEAGVCSGCNYHENRSNLKVDWDERELKLKSLLEKAKLDAIRRGVEFDCLIPVSGGKDSHLQVWLMKEIYGMNPLLVHFNHGFNTFAGLRNLDNLVKKSGLKLVTRHAEPASAKKLARLMIEKVGDITWHYHAGIMTAPFQVAVEQEIPLIIWGEHGFGELTGLVSLLDFPEFTNWKRKEHDMRGIDPKSLIGQNGISDHDIAPYIFPDDAKMDSLQVRGIYLSSYLKWDAFEHAKFMIEKWDFSGIRFKRDRTFNLYSKIEDHANDIHDYMKFLKFGYGRATDDVSMEIRHKRLSRKTGLAIVREYDSNTPSSLEFYCDYLELSVGEFYKLIEPLRDRNIWELGTKGHWQIKKELTAKRDMEFCNQDDDDDVVFELNLRNMYFNPNHPPTPSLEDKLNLKHVNFLEGI